MKLPDVWTRATPIFDDENLVSFAGLVPVLALAERAGLSELIDERVRFKATRVVSAGVNPVGKLTSIIAGMAVGADCIDDLDVLRAGGMKQTFGGVYAAATLGQLLREFTHGHTLQLASVLRAHLVELAHTTDLLPGIGTRAFVDIDSLLRPVYGHAKQGASYGHTKIAGKQILRKGLSPLITTISTSDAAPVIAGIRLRAGRAIVVHTRRNACGGPSASPIRSSAASTCLWMIPRSCAPGGEMARPGRVLYRHRRPKDPGSGARQ